MATNAAELLWSVRLDISYHSSALTVAFERFWATYVDPRTGVVYDAAMGRAMDLADQAEPGGFTHEPLGSPCTSAASRPDLGPWPTPREVAESSPTVNGWETAIENAPGEGGPLLAGLVLGAFDLPEPRRIQCIDLIYRGLLSLWSVPGKTGFVCRGYLPRSKAFYRQTSFDQMPYFIFGLNTYARSRFCPPEHREQIAACVHSAMKWMQDAHWRLPLYGTDVPARHGSGRSEDPGQTAKMLAMLLMAHEITGDAHWRHVYESWRDENGRRALQNIQRQDKVWEPYQLLYVALMLRQLERLDQDSEARLVYRQQRWMLMYPLAIACSRHVYPQFAPILPNQSRSIHARPDTLIDFRPALAEACRRLGFRPEQPLFHWTYREIYELDRLGQGSAGDGYLTYDYFCAMGAHRLVMSDWPADRPHWGAERTRRAIEGFLNLLCLEHPLRFVPKLALSMAPNLEMGV